MLTGDTRDWYSNTVLPRLAREAADVLSLLTLPHGAGAYPSDFFSGSGLLSSRYAELQDNEDTKPHFDKVVTLSKLLISGVVTPGNIENPEVGQLVGWCLGSVHGDEGNNVLGKTTHFDIAQKESRQQSFSTTTTTAATSTSRRM